MISLAGQLELFGSGLADTVPKALVAREGDGMVVAVLFREGREAEAERHVSNTERGRMPDPLHLAMEVKGGLWPDFPEG